MAWWALGVGGLSTCRFARRMPDADFLGLEGCLKALHSSLVPAMRDLLFWHAAFHPSQRDPDALVTEHLASVGLA